jgi:hypothetical protein
MKEHELRQLIKEEILKEIMVNKPIHNYLAKLEILKQKIENTQEIKEKQLLALQCAELVLPIWNYYYPKDDRPKKAIEAAKKYLKEPTEENKNFIIIDEFSSSWDAANFSYSSAAAASLASITCSTPYIVDALNYAIRATKSHFKLK